MGPNKITKKFGILLLVNFMGATLWVILYTNFNYGVNYPQQAYFYKAFNPFQQRQIHNITFKNSSYLILRHSASTHNDTKRVLIFGFRYTVAGSKECPAKCIYHSDVADIERSHAVIISPMLQIAHQQKYSFPKYRNPDQYWVLFHNDMTFYIQYDKMKKYLGSFNLTMTWRPDSDIIIGDGYVERRTVPKKVESGSFIMAAKTGLVAWVVSNCKSGRKIYVKELQKFISVDIYGKCGNLTCPNNHSCWAGIGKKYKFYLAFENSICYGYATEKVYRTLQMNMVPIVLGGANYKGILPEKSYIDALDFASPRELATYLKKLDSDDKLYLQYFQWKEFNEVHRLGDSLRKGFCQLCHILHDPQHPHQEYKNVEEWMKNGCDNQLISRMYSQWK